MNLKTYKSNGFTLIELVVVIVILGIMAAIAGPKFVDLQSDARRSVMQGIESSIRSAATLVYSKALIAGQESGDGAVTISGITGSGTGGAVTTSHGYPTVEDINLLLDLSGATSISETADGVFVYSGFTQAQCSVVYVESTADGQAPTITPTLSGC